MRYNSGAAKAPHLNISDEQIEGIVRFYAGFPICSGEQVETGSSFQFVQVSKLQTRIFPGFFFNLLIFLSSALGQLRSLYHLK